ncbi:LUD domain-containing protein [Carboxydothermus hydrogenoformans]|uniref:Iron-sulfur cluster-binding protein n=1 Tax=Carboxydothermus hydrogenoformans (strain ATCC BAA-161 / DSM 6008 / Z-2901) TaxID=246194 RepID=Q3AFR5_CARHZ|nr:LUD domain-containing protein [Carboxydothermus hydrogenoformans]ABB13727.1 iron-sulfur cluster-binding protein [Carboxydothermus hydrogenoformans Z-2901]
MVDLEKDLAALAETLVKAANNPNINLALSRAVKSYRENVNKALSRFPHTVERAYEVREIKLQALSNLQDLYEKAAKSIEENHGKAYLAKDGSEALKIVSEIVGTGKLIVKVKSMVGEEIGLREHLEERGNTLWETDLGEFIQQLRNDRPMHILSPAIHIPREEVAKLFSAFFEKEIPPEIAAEVAAVREFMREKYFKADIGISGANIVAADTGSIFIIENEGNGRLATGAPPVHIVIVGLEKLVPTLDDAFKTAEVTWRYAQYTVPSYVNIISGPSKTGDIEKVTTYGAHGPKELHVIFLDNGRLSLSQNETFKEALLCLRCGGCLYECPVFSLTAGYYGYKYLGGIGSIWTAFVAGGIEKAAPLAYVCLRCGRCQERCPMKIDVPRMTLALRQLLTGNHPG